MHAPAAMDAVALIGIATAFFAATIGLTQNDIKKVFAYSTVSQLGYMFLGVGCGAFSAGIFHLMTHAFFKALLFLGAGSVIHALAGEQDMRNMGGLRKKIPWTFVTMMCAAWPSPAFRSSGFFSKDAILLAAYDHAPWMYWVGVVTAGMTAFYVFRAMFMTFFGKYRGHAHPHESPLVMCPAGGAGRAFARRRLHFKIPEFLSDVFPAGEVPEDYADGRLGGVWPGRHRAGLLMYVVKPAMADRSRTASRASTRWSTTSISWMRFTMPRWSAAGGGSRAVLWKGVDAGLIDGMVNGVGRGARRGRRSAAAAIGQHSQLCHLGAVGSVLVIVAMGFAGGVR